MACDRVIERSATDQPMNPICFIGKCMSESTFELPLRKAMQYVILLLWGKMRVGYRASTHKTYPVLFGPSIPGGVSLQNRRQVLQPDDHGMYTYCSMMFFGISSFNTYIYIEITLNSYIYSYICTYIYIEWVSPAYYPLLINVAMENPT